MPQIVEHLESVVGALDRPPIIMGHSAGGAFTQILLDHGYGAAGVAINSAPTEGVKVVPRGSGTSLSGGILLDAIQTELASTAPTPYSPTAEIEMGIGVGGAYSMWFAGQTPIFNLMLRNEGALTNVRAKYTIYNTWNSNCQSLSASYTVPPGTNTNFVVNLPTNAIIAGIPSQKTGWFRIVTSLPEITDSYDEAKTIVYPYASNTTAHATNDWLGGHPNSSVWHSRKEGLAGRRFARGLSPNSRNFRWETVEPTRGNISFDLFYITNWNLQGLMSMGCLTPFDGNWPSWAVMTDTPSQVNTTNVMFPYVGMWDGMAWSNFCYQAVLAMKDHVHYWEVGPNEPYQSGPQGTGTEFPSEAFPYAGATNLPVNTRVATNYARLLKYGIDGITNADRTAKIIGIAGASGNGNWALDVWNALTPDIQSWIYAVSNHRYANDQKVDPNVPFYIAVTESANTPQGWMDRFKGIRPVWNTESSAVGVDYFQGMNALWRHDWRIDFSTYGPGALAEAARSEQSNRMLTEPVRLITTVLRDIGFGFSKYFYYDTRYFNDDSFGWSFSPAIYSWTYPTDYMKVDRPEMVAMSVATHFIQAPGLGSISNVTSAHAFPMEMYFYNGAHSGPWSNKFVVAGWSTDKTNRTMTFANSHFAQYDFMGNLVKTNSLTAQLTRVPSYFVSGTLSGTDMSNYFRLATETLEPDTLGPMTTVDIAPIGPWSGDTNRQYFKWTAIDDISVAFATHADPFTFFQSDTKTNVVYSWKLNGGTYTDPSQSNHCWLDHIPAGTNTFWVKAWDRAGNLTEVSHPFVSDADPGPPRELSIPGNLNVGTMTVIQ